MIIVNWEEIDLAAFCHLHDTYLWTYFLTPSEFTLKVVDMFSIIGNTILSGQNTKIVKI
jgi:hypothetical protein